MKNLWGTVLFFDIDRQFTFDRLLTSDSFCGRTIPRRFSKEESWLFSFGTMTTNDRVGEFGVIRLSRLAGWKWFSQRKDIFYLLRLTFRSCGLKVHLDSEKRKNKWNNKRQESPRQPEKRENPFRACREKGLQKSFFDFSFAHFERVFVSETRNSQNMLWNTHFESVNLKNYPLICDSFERELRVEESENFIGSAGVVGSHSVWAFFSVFVCLLFNFHVAVFFLRLVGNDRGYGLWRAAGEFPVATATKEMRAQRLQKAH